MELKSVFFLLFSAVFVPVGIRVVGRHPWCKDACAFLLVAGTTKYDLRQINFFSREWYRGTTRGFEFCWLDYLWIFILVDEVRRQAPGQRSARPYGLISMWMFFAYNAMNIAISEPRLFGLFELSKMLRGILVFVAVARYVKSERELRVLLWALGLAVIFEWHATVYTRLFLGETRPSGSLSHPNSVSMYNLIAVPVLLAVALSDTDRRLRRLCAAASLFGITSVVLTVSRAGLVSLVMVVGAVGVTCGSFRITAKKAAVAVALLIAGSALWAKMGPAFEARFTEGTLDKEYGGDAARDGRGSYLILAKLITDDYPLGCGLNNWSWYVSSRYGAMIGLYYLPYPDVDEGPPERQWLRSRAFVDAPQAAPGHSLYAITLGETGWPGVILFAGVWLRWIQMAGGFLRRRSAAFLSRFGVGAFFGLAGAFAQSLSEWEIRQTPLFFLLHILLGAVAAAHPVRPSVMTARPRSP